MTLKEHFEKWLKEEHFPEADISMKNDQYVNSCTRLIWTGWQGCHQHYTVLKREKEGREFT